MHKKRNLYISNLSIKNLYSGNQEHVTLFEREEATLAVLTFLRDIRVDGMVSLVTLGGRGGPSVVEADGEERGAGPLVRIQFFLCIFLGALFFFSPFFFFGERGEQKIRELHFDGRAPHGFAEECQCVCVINLFTLPHTSRLDHGGSGFSAFLNHYLSCTVPLLLYSGAPLTPAPHAPRECRSGTGLLGLFPQIPRKTSCRHDPVGSVCGRHPRILSCPGHPKSPFSAKLMLHSIGILMWEKAAADPCCIWLFCLIFGVLLDYSL